MTAPAASRATVVRMAMETMNDAPADPPDCGHDMCLMEEALHESGKCTEYDQIVVGVYCPQSVCRSNAARRATAGGAGG